MSRAYQDFFQTVPQNKFQRSVFKSPHRHLTTCNVDYIIPVFNEDVLPGDSWNVSSTFFTRLTNSTRFPLMDNLWMDLFWFFIPDRLIWSNFEKYMGYQENPGDSTDYMEPILDLEEWGQNRSMTLTDYLGVPVNALATTVARSCYHRAYMKVINDWFRDQNLQESIPLFDPDLPDGPDDVTAYELQKRCKRHDLFTSLLLQPQKGDDVILPLGESAPVFGTGKALGLTDGTNFGGLSSGETGAFSHYSYASMFGAAVGATPTGATFASLKAQGVPTKIQMDGQEEPYISTGLLTDLSEAIGPTVNEFREYFAVQRFLEKQARGGTRYVETLNYQFGVISPDFRLQRSELLHWSKHLIKNNVTPVNSFTDVSGTTKYPGDLGGYCTGMANHGFSKAFVEHGIVLCLVNYHGDCTYQNGLSKKFKLRTLFERYWPTFANIGEQPVLREEIYMDTTEELNATVLGYAEPWYWYRSFPNRLSGAMKSVPSGMNTLHYYHLAENFTSAPELTDEFIVYSTPISRVMNVATPPNFLLDMQFDLTLARPMPVRSVPGYLDHF